MDFCVWYWGTCCLVAILCVLLPRRAAFYWGLDLYVTIFSQCILCRFYASISVLKTPNYASLLFLLFCECLRVRFFVLIRRVVHGCTHFFSFVLSKVHFTFNIAQFNKHAMNTWKRVTKIRKKQHIICFVYCSIVSFPSGCCFLRIFRQFWRLYLKLDKTIMMHLTNKIRLLFALS